MKTDIRKINIPLTAGTALVLLTAVVALVSCFWTPYALDDTAGGLRLSAPDALHWAGTDKLGRDLFSQLMVGARYAILVAVLSPLIAAAVGIPFGLLAAAGGKILDESLSYLFDAMIAFPAILLAMLVVTVQGASMSSAILAIGLSSSAAVARVTRVNALRVLATDYVRAARASGVSRPAVLLRHVLPNISPILLVQLTLVASGAILAEASLSYLGLGSPPPQASWGRMLMEAQSSVLTAPWGAVIPGCAIMTLVLGLNFLGDGIREILDPEEEMNE